MQILSILIFSTIHNNKKKSPFLKAYMNRFNLSKNLIKELPMIIAIVITINMI